MLKIENLKFNPMDFNQLYAWCREYQKKHGYPPMVTFLCFSNDLYRYTCFWLRYSIISITHLNDVQRGVEEVRKTVLEGNCKTMPMGVYDYVSDLTTEVVGWLGNDEFSQHLTDLLLRHNPAFDYKLKRDYRITHCKSGIKLYEYSNTTIVRSEDGRLKEVEK